GVDSLSFPNSTFTIAPDQARFCSLSFGVFGDVIGPGPKDGDLVINLDPAPSTFTLHLKVLVLGPRMEIRVDDVSVSGTGGRDFGPVVVGQTASKNLTIASIGTEALTGHFDVTTLGPTQVFQLGTANRDF